MRRGVGVTEAIRNTVPEWVVDVFSIVTLLGDWLFIVPALGLLYLGDVVGTLRAGDQGGEKPQRGQTSQQQPLCSDRTVFVIGAVFGGLALILLLESLFGLSRPPEELHAVTPSEYGFPSGHTMAATVFWGGLALWSTVGRFRTRLLVAALVITVVGLSRLVLGVHFFVDIPAAILFGGLYLAAVDRWLRDRPAAVFALATVIAIGATISTGGSTRTLLAVGGTITAAIGWRVVEWPPVRGLVVTVASRVQGTR